MTLPPVTRNHMRLEAQERKLSSTLITMLFSFVVFCSGVFKNIRIICFVAFFYFLLFISCLYIDKAFYVLLLQLFSFIFVLISSFTQSVVYRKN